MSRRALDVEIEGPVATVTIERVLDYCADKSVGDGLEYVATWNSAFLQSKDMTEAFTAFMEQRKAEFTGE